MKKSFFAAYLFLSVQLAFLLSFLIEPATLQKVQAAETDQFSHKAFETTWQRTDQPVIAKRTDRSWYWGSAPLAKGFYEPYAEAPYSRRLVQYFDKARMEINNPNTGQVTNGLLVVEMLNGRTQQGDAIFDEQGGGAAVALAGDLENVSPTYQQLASVYNTTANYKLGEPITGQWGFSKPATQPFTRYATNDATKVAKVQNGLSIPQAFWEFMNQGGLIYVNNRFVDGLVSDWKFAMGLPITEPYWARVKVAGVEKDVLFQAFERRVLTYTPDNSAAFQVEMGNVGLHYVQWRYKGNLPNYANPLLSIFDEANQPDWYKATTVLNIRTAPTPEAQQLVRTDSRPFFSQLQPGDRIKVLRTVIGEEVEPGNNRWYQIYEKPDLFVYAKYTEPFKMPDFPTPPKTYKGLWVAVSVNKQMMAVYNGTERIFTTLVATGRSGYETPIGSYAAIGGWRPLSQTMEGGNRASDFYRLEEVRYVTYFFQDNAIHGSYWHAKYGIAPQSRGCVNATVYDASLIHQLPVGTPIEVF